MEKQSSSTSLSSLSSTSITKTTRFDSCILLCCDYFYDILSGLISLLDVITDIMILIYYYQTKKDIFFMISLCIILFAQLSYSILFIIRFARHLKLRYKFLIFFIILPISPFMSYIFYWASLQNNKLSLFLTFIGLQVSEYEPPSEKQAEKLGITKLQEYFAEKLVNHTGFVLEALFESFPQSILQCIAMIIYYNESTDYYNALTFISILISLISISSKSLMFSGSLNINTFFFNWLCAICDFHGLYLIFVWIFFVPDIIDSNTNGHGVDDYSLSLFASIWCWKFIICTVSPIVVGTIILSIFIAIDLYDDITLDMYQESISEYICKFWIIIGIFIIFIIVWSFGVILLIIFGEVLCCTWIAIGFYYYNESRFSHSRTFMKIFYWLYLSNNSNDLLIRLISINYRLSSGKMMNDHQLHTFLTNVIRNHLKFDDNAHDIDTQKKTNHSNDLSIKISDKDPDLFDNLPTNLPIDNVCTTNMLFESADDYDKQQKQLSDYFEEYEGTITTNNKFKDFGTSLLIDDDYINHNDTLKSMKDITYKDFRIRCKNKHKTHLISVILKQMVKAIHDDKTRINELNQQQTYVYGINILEITIAKFIIYIQLIADYILWFLFIPLYAISRIFNLLIPIIGIILIPHIQYIQFFQWILTALYFILLIGLIILFPSVWKFQFLAWHVAPGYSIISPKIHNNNTLTTTGTGTRTTRTNTSSYAADHEHEQKEEEYTTTLEEILSDRSSAQNSSNNDDNDNDNDNNNSSNNFGNGTRRERRIRRKHKRQQRKQQKKQLKRIREKIRKYEKLEFYEWVKEFYKKCINIPIISNQINDKFGTDIGSVILSYLPSIIDDDDNVIMKEVVIDDEASKTISDSYNDPLKDYYDDNDIMDDDKNSHSIIDDDNPLLFMETNQSLLYYNNSNNTDNRNCNTVNLSELYIDNTNNNQQMTS